MARSKDLYIDFQDDAEAVPGYRATRSLKTAIESTDNFLDFKETLATELAFDDQDDIDDYFQEQQALSKGVDKANVNSSSAKKKARGARVAAFIPLIKQGVGEVFDHLVTAQRDTTIASGVGELQAGIGMTMSAIGAAAAGGPVGLAAFAGTVAIGIGSKSFEINQKNALANREAQISKTVLGNIRTNGNR